MTEQPVRQKIPRWVIISAAVGVLCIAAFFIIIILTLLSPGINASRLPSECMQNNPGMSREACETWADDVWSTSEFDTCYRNWAATGQPRTSTLYVCLVDAGVGPNELQ